MGDNRRTIYLTGRIMTDKQKSQLKSTMEETAVGNMEIACMVLVARKDGYPLAPLVIIDDQMVNKLDGFKLRINNTGQVEVESTRVIA